MKDSAIVVFKDWVGLVLAGIGISFPPHHFFGGLCLAIAGASFARKFSPEQTERELWVVVLGAILMAIIAALLAPHVLPEWPVQLKMAAAGFFSRYLARFSLRAAGMVESRTDQIVDGVIDKVLPGADGEGKP